MFADDTSTCIHGKDVKTVCDKLPQEAENINTWVRGKQNDNEHWQNYKCMLIASQQKLQHTSNQHLTVSMQGKQVTNITNEKLLGFQIDNNLSLKQQIKKVKQTIC